jgi:hypothetical protein
VRIEPFQVLEPPEPTRIDVPVFVVVAERGPIDQPQRIVSWPQFTAVFGSFVHAGLGAYAAKAFFDNGGRACWVVRVAAPATDTTTTGLQPPDRGASIVGDLDGLVVGAAATLSQGALRRTYLVTGVDELTHRVTWDRPLHADFDLTLPIDVAAGAAASSSAAASGAVPCLTIDASSPGRWGNQLVVVIGPGRPAATVSRIDEPSDASRTVVRSTVGFDAGTTVTVAQDLAGVVTTVDRVVAQCDRVNAVLWWDVALPATIDVTQPVTVRSRPFTITVAERGVTREVFADLQAVRGGPRFVEDVLAVSTYLRVTSLVGLVPDTQALRLGGGRDGVAALTPAEFLGDDLLAGVGGRAQGLAASVDLDEPGLVAMPDLVAPSVPGLVLDPPVVDADPCWPCQPPPQPPAQDDVDVLEARLAFDADAVLTAQQAVIDHCERNAERIALLDPPGGDGQLGVAALIDRAVRLPSSYAVLLAPWIAVVDPAVVTGRGPRRVPPSAHYAGVISRTDGDRGPWAAPANTPVEWAHGLGATFDDDRHALLNEAGVVVLRGMPGLGVTPLGVRTLSADPLWLFVPVRRSMIWVRRMVRHALAWTAFEPNDEHLAASVAALLDGVLNEVWADGGLAGAEAREAFFVQPADASTTPDGEFICTIGVALARPAEFITVQVRRSDNRLELTEQPERGSWP